MRERIQQLVQPFTRSLVAFPLKTLKRITEVLAVLVSIYVISQFIPKSWLSALPATGGDMGSHFWPVKVLHDFGLPHLTLRPWNPGNNGGEGLLVHYFPMPFILMALLGYLIPLGMAFNIGTLLPVLTLPISVWGGLRLMGLRSPAPFLAALFSSAMILNEGYSMWGGNTLSTLAGQFCHMYALNFLVLGFGFLWKEIALKKVPWKSGLLFSAVALSHGYIYFGVPPLILLTLIFHPKGSFRTRILIGTLSGLFSFLIAAWFLGPMILNGPWVTPHSFTWQFSDWTQEIIPRIFEPLILSWLVSILILSYRSLTRRDNLMFRIFMFWWFSGLVYLGFFFVFRALQLVDVRALPQTQLFWSLSSAVAVTLALRPLSARLKYLFTLLLVTFMAPWVSHHVVKFPIWLNWNYSGWQSKNKYYELTKLSEVLKGTLSDPRVAYEHHTKNNFVGTERVFEMLPYFANRATTESLYLQSTILAPMIYSFTSEIGEVASCPFNQWPCLHSRLLQAQSHMDLLGIQELILSTEFAKQQAQIAPFLKNKFSTGGWTIFESTNHISMVETFSTPPEFIPFDKFRIKFWDWYRNYEKGQRFLVTSELPSSLPDNSAWSHLNKCHPSSSVDFSGITLKTDCPGTAHLLKYAYHPSFTSSGGEQLFLVSPGFIGVVPRSSEIKLEFGSSWKWSFCRWVSFVFSLIMVSGFTPLIRDSLKSIWKRASRNQPTTFQRSPKKTLNRLQKKKNTNEKLKPPNTLFPILIAGIAGFYLFISYKTDSIFFWNWRKLNFRDFEIIDSRQDWGTLHKNEGIDGGPLIVKGEIHYSGLSTHANSEITIRLRNSNGFFTGKCAYPDSAFGANIQCEIRSPSKVLFTSSPLSNDNREQSFKVSLPSQKELTLVFKTLRPDINSAHAAWLELVTQD